MSWKKKLSPDNNAMHLDSALRGVSDIIRVENSADSPNDSPPCPP